MGIFNTLYADQTTIGPLKVLYQEFQGHFKEIGKNFTKFRDIFKDYNLYKDNSVEGCGFYFDDPNSIQHKHEMRYSLGVILKSIESQKLIDQLLSENPLLKYVELPKITAFRTTFLYRNAFSYMIGAMKAYPLLKNKIVEVGLAPDSQIVCSFEHYEPNYQKITDYMLLIDQVNSPKDSKFYLTTIPVPAYKKQPASKQKKL